MKRNSLDRVVDNLIDGIKENKELLDKIISYSEFKSENQKNWDVVADLQNTARLLINEQKTFLRYKIFENSIFKISKKLEKKLKSDFAFHKMKAKEIANDILNDILEQKISFSIF